MRRKAIRIITYALCVLLLGLTACGETSQPIVNTQTDTGFVPSKPGMYDSADTAVIVKKNKKDKTITFYNMPTKRNYTLEYDGTSKWKDKYGESLSIEQVKEGEIVDITFLKSNKKLNSLQMSNESWKLTDVSRFTLEEKKKEITVGDEIYNYDDDLLIFSGTKQVQVMDVNQSDTLTLQGIGHKLYSVSIDKGHGYLRLKNDEYFIGGWIEVGQSIIQKISEDMLLVVPEGSYDVMVSAGSASGSKRVTIQRDEETELDIGDIKGEDLVKYGNLLFVLSPSNASVYIDGEEIDTSIPFKTEYGVHQMMAKADEYETIIQYIKVGQENATIQVTLSKGKDGEVKEQDQMIMPSPSPTVAVAPQGDTVSAGSYKVSIEAPTEAEVYVDGSYVGISPISFPKTAGTHVVTLRKPGYATRSYTIELDSTQKNESFSFSDLLKIE